MSHLKRRERETLPGRGRNRSTGEGEGVGVRELWDTEACVHGVRRGHVIVM